MVEQEVNKVHPEGPVDIRDEIEQAITAISGELDVHRSQVQTNTMVTTKAHEYRSACPMCETPMMRLQVTRDGQKLTYHTCPNPSCAMLDKKFETMTIFSKCILCGNKMSVIGLSEEETQKNLRYFHYCESADCHKLFADHSKPDQYLE